MIPGPGLAETLPDLLLWVLQDIGQAVRESVKEGTLVSTYLVGSAVQQPPPVVWVGAELVSASDLDLLFFVRDGTPVDERRSLVAAIEGRRHGWKAYAGIHVGCRFRPVSAVRRAVAEYASWGVDMEHGVLLLRGSPLIQTLPREERSRLAAPSRALLLENAISKLWFVIYSLPHEDLKGTLDGVPAFVLRKRFAAAAVRLARLHALALHRHQERPLHPQEWEDTRWRSRLLRSGLQTLAAMADPDRRTLDTWERAAALELVAVAAGEVVDVLGARGCHSRRLGGWMSAVMSMGRLLVSAAPNPHALSREAASVLRAEDRDDAWPQVVTKLHRAQFPVFSRNLISYS